MIDTARSVADQARERLRHGTEHTVAALAGATGSGKSTLFNTVSGTDLSQTGVRRPTTSSTHACVWGPSADDLLDWLEVRLRHLHTERHETFDGLVLLDLPDHDSTRVEHRLEVDRLVELVDLLVWVVDPEKYADAAIHDGYLKPLASHREVMVVVLNQVDRIEPAERAGVVSDLTKLLVTDGLDGVPVVAVSAKTGEGIPELGAILAERVSQRTAAVARLSADVNGAATALAGPTGSSDGTVDRAARNELITALTAASGAGVVAGAVATSHRRDAAGATGWPFTRWLRRFRPDPLKRLHLERSGSIGRPSLPEPGPTERSRVNAAVRNAAESAAGDLPDPWPSLARDAPPRGEDLDDKLRQAVSATDLGLGRDPIWWKVVGALQILLAVAAIAGALWLLALFGFAYLRLPDPPTPDVRGIPVPTAMLIGGLVLGLLIAAISRWCARVGSNRRERRAVKRLEEKVAAVADDDVLAPIHQELSFAGDIRTAATAALG